MTLDRGAFKTLVIMAMATMLNAMLQKPLRGSLVFFPVSASWCFMIKPSAAKAEAMMVVSMELSAAAMKPKAKAKVPGMPKCCWIESPALLPTTMISNDTINVDTVEKAIPRRQALSSLPTAIEPLKKMLQPIEVEPTRLRTVSQGAAAWGKDDIPGTDGTRLSNRLYPEKPTVVAAARNKQIMAIITTPRPTPITSTLSM